MPGSTTSLAASTAPMWQPGPLSSVRVMKQISGSTLGWIRPLTWISRAFGHDELVDQEAEHRVGHAHLLHLGVRGQPRLVADHAGAARALARQDAVLDGVGVVPVHVGVRVGDLQRVLRLQLAVFQQFGKLVEGGCVQCHVLVLQATCSPRALASVSAVSSIMSSWPPTMPRRPISTRISRAGTPYFSLGALGEQQERAVHAGIAEGERVAVDADREVHDRHHQVFGHVLDLEDVDAGCDAHAVAHGHQHFHRRVAGAGAQARGGRVDAAAAHLDGGQRVGHAHGQVVVAMKAELGLGLERLAHGAELFRHVVRQHVAGRVGDVDAVGAVALHEPGLRHQALGAVHVAIIRKPTVSMPELARHADVLLADVGLGAVRGHADGVHAQVVRHAQVVDGADAGHQQGRDLGVASSAEPPRRGIPRRCARESRS